MNRIINWEYIVTGVFIGGLLIHCFLTDSGAVTLTLQGDPDFISAIITIATNGICVLMIGRLVPIYRKKHKEIVLVEILISIFLFVGLVFFTQGLSSIIQLTPHQLKLVFTQSIFFYMAIISPLLAHFQIEVNRGGFNENHNRAWFIVVVCVALILDIGITLDTLFGLERWQLALSGGPTVLILFFLFVNLSYTALHTKENISDPVVKRSYRLMGLGWALFFIGFVLLVSGGFFDFEAILDPIIFIILGSVTFGVILIATSLLYVGFTAPMKIKS